MEQKYDFNIDEKKQFPNIKLENNYNPPDNPNLSIPLKQIHNSIKNSDFHLENQNFQIISKKVNLIDKNKKEEILNSLNKNDNIDNKIVNANELDDKIREYSKKNNSIDQNELLFKINSIENNNKNIYMLLNSYYKDIDINFKDNKINNNCKNFLPKNNLLQNQNKTTIPDMPNYIPYTGYQNQYSNNPFIFNDNRFQSYYYFPENAFSINNEYNFYFTTNINKYSYNFHNHENKGNKENKKNISRPRFYPIDLDNILKGIDTRTTVMIRHIPNKYSCKNILDEINVACKDKYDFFYLPLDYENNCNLGYCFINFIHPLHIIYFYNIFKSRKWFFYNSYKECDLTYGKYQGIYELTNNIEKNLSKDNKRQKPIILQVKNPPKIDLFKKYYVIIKEYQPGLLDKINWI